MANYITEVTPQSYEKLISENEYALVDFYGTWCGPCKQLLPLVEQISETYKDTLTVGKFDVDQDRDLLASMSIRSIPALILFKNGQEVGRNVGSATMEKLTDFIESNK